MLYPETILFKVVMAALGLIGFLVAQHIHRHKQQNAQPLVCPLKMDCTAVVHSDYSKIFGIPLEILGMVYYACIFLTYATLAILQYFLPGGLPALLVLVLTPVLFIASIGSLAAFIFSIYLLGVQFFVLRKGCFWCFVSAAVSISIFLLTVI